jgi:hypothetical protein
MRVIAVLLIALVAACGGDGLEATHRGAYFGGDNRFNMNMFTPCGDTATLYVEGNPQTVERLRRKHESMSRSMFRPIYIECEGRRRRSVGRSTWASCIPASSTSIPSS